MNVKRDYRKGRWEGKSERDVASPLLFLPRVLPHVSSPVNLVSRSPLFATNQRVTNDATGEEAGVIRCLGNYICKKMGFYHRFKPIVLYNSLLREVHMHVSVFDWKYFLFITQISNNFVF